MRSPQTPVRRRRPDRILKISLANPRRGSRDGACTPTSDREVETNASSAVAAAPRVPVAYVGGRVEQAVSSDHQDPATTAHLIRWEVVETEHDRKREKGTT
jgi:hypothetical protein